MADEHEIIERFKGVEHSAPATAEQKAAVTEIRNAVVQLALKINANTSNARYRATALTELETSAMFAVKGVFQK